MATTKNERIRFRYGICLNDQCQKCKSKEVQEIPARKELVCKECGKPLRECPPPVKKSNAKLIGIIAAAVVVLGGGAVAIALSGGDKEPIPADVENVDSTTTKVPEDTIEVKATTPVEELKAEKNTDKPKVVDSPKPVNPSWGKYDGERNANGLPHGSGVLRITRSTTINGETAQPGERIEGVFRNGYVNLGKWYKNDGNVIVIKDVKVI